MVLDESILNMINNILQIESPSNPDKIILPHPALIRLSADTISLKQQGLVNLVPSVSFRYKRKAK